MRRIDVGSCHPHAFTEPAIDLDDLERRLEHGRELGWALRHVEAEKVVREVLEEVSTQPETPAIWQLQVRARLTLAYVRFELSGDGDSCLALLDDARQMIIECGLDELRLAEALSRGLCLMRAGRLDEAADAFEVDPDVRALAPREDRLRWLLNRGAHHLESGRVSLAAESFAACEREARTAGLASLAQKARHNRGYTAYLQGDLPSALRLMGTPTDIAEQDLVSELLHDPIVALDRGRAMLEAGLLDEAESQLAAAASQLATASRSHDEGEVRLVLSRTALLRGELGRARQEAQRAEACFLAQGNDRWWRLAIMAGFGIEIEQLQAAAPDDTGTPARLRSLAARLDNFRADVMRVGDHWLIAPLRLMRCETALMERDVTTAAALLEGLEVDETLGFSVRLRWHRARAELASLEAPGRVLSLVRTGLAELATQQARLGSLDLRTAMAVHGHELAALGVSAALDHGDPDEVHEAVELARASATRISSVTAAVEPDEVELLARLRRATTALDGVDPAREPGPAARLQHEVSSLMGQLRRLAWERDASDEASGVVSRAEVMQRLRATGALALSLVGHARRQLVVRLGVDGLEVVDVGPLGEIAELSRLVTADLRSLLLSRLPRALRDVVMSSLLRNLQHVDQLLAPALGGWDHDLVVVPQGPSSSLPWTLLPSRLGRATTVAPCLTAWARSMDVVATGTPSVAVVAGPSLQRAEDEVTVIAEGWDDAVAVLGTDATTSRVASYLRATPLVHLAMHGHHREFSPLFSSVQLSDGPLFAHEVKRGGAQLVVLSACEVGSSTVREGEEHLGFTAALLHAGAGTVVAGVTPVLDHVARDVMVDFHERLRRGRSPAAAIGASVEAAWSAGAVAPFVSVGAGLRPLETG